MIKKLKAIHFFPLLILMIVSILVSLNAVAGDFEDMMAGEMNEFRNQQNDFQTYRDQINSEFKSYKKIIDEEFNKYKDEILKYWDKPEVSTKKKFVEYSPDFKTKKVVDFEKETIELNIILPANQSPEKIDKKIDEKLQDLIGENSNQAYQRDRLAQNIEKKLVKKVKGIKKSVINEIPILADVIVGTAKPLKKQLVAAVKKLRQTEKMIQEPAPKSETSQLVTVKIKLPSGTMAKKAETYIGTVQRFAKKRNLDPALLLAVMQTESAFNPMARSYVPAYGLMQIVPKSAGLDASEVVLGKQTILSPSFLYNGENNINMGAAYLYILNYRYLKSIKNEKSRLYCVIAAYNTGAGNVARAFTGKTNIRSAAKKINKLSPEKVYKRLIKKLPHDETKNYLKNVSKRIQLYK